ncbi:MAG: glycosyltransferase [Janthinobacterium lividum]
MIGVIIPAHDEEAFIGPTLRAALRAAAHPGLLDEPVRIVVVLDDCSDATEEIARGYRVETLPLTARNVGRARAAGAAMLLEAGADWLAFTDADTQVSADWLVAQRSLGVDAVCGSVAVTDWWRHGPDFVKLAERFARRYVDADGHRHIHGANLGVSAQAYRLVGGFSGLACGEDVALVEALMAAGANVAWSALPRVATSARPQARVRGGFGDTLLAMAAE